MFKDLELSIEADREKVTALYTDSFNIANENLNGLLSAFKTHCYALETLLSLKKIAEKSITDNQGLDIVAAEVLAVTTNHLYKKINLEARTMDFPSIESYGKTNGIFNTRLVIGNIDFTINDIVKFITATLKKLYAFFLQLIDTATNKSVGVKKESTRLLKATYLIKEKDKANVQIYNPKIQESMVYENTIDHRAFNKYQAIHSDAVKEVQYFVKRITSFSETILAREVERMKASSIVSTIDAIASIGADIPPRLPEKDSFFDGSVFYIKAVEESTTYRLHVNSTTYREPTAAVKILSLNKSAIVDLLSTNIKLMEDTASVRLSSPIIKDSIKHIELFLKEGDVEPGTVEYETIYKASVAASANLFTLVETLRELFRINIGLGELTNLYVETSLTNISKQEIF